VDISWLRGNGGQIIGSIEAKLLQHILEQWEFAASRYRFMLPRAFDVECVELPRSDLTVQETKNEAAIRLLREWMADESGYDEQVWPIVKKAIEENRSSYRRRFSE